MSVGEHLKQQRIIRKLSLATVARAIKLDEKLLGEIEQEQATHVAPIYRNGYIRSYARYLQIPAEEIEGLITEKEVSQPLVRNIFSEPPRHNSVERWLRATSYVLASLLIGTLAWQFTHEAVRLSQNGPQLHSAANNTVDAGDSTTQNSAPEITGPVNASIALLGALHSSDSTGVDAADQAWAAVSQPLLLDGESRLQVSVSADSWVEITDADVTTITIQNQSTYDLQIAGTTGSAPTNAAHSIVVPPHGLIMREALSDLFPGVSATRVFIRGNGQVFFSHA